MTILSWQGVKITRVNGVDALLTTYTRSINDAPFCIGSHVQDSEQRLPPHNHDLLPRIGKQLVGSGLGESRRDVQVQEEMRLPNKSVDRYVSPGADTG